MYNVWKELKLCLFTDDMVICAENPKELTKQMNKQTNS